MSIDLDLDDKLPDNLYDGASGELSDEFNDDIAPSLDSDGSNGVFEVNDKESLDSGLKNMVFSDDLPVETSSEKSKEKPTVWSYLLYLLIIIICIGIIMLLGHHAFMTVNDQLSSTLQAVTESEQRVDKRLHQLQTTLLKEISDGRKEAESHQQIVTQKISELQKEISTPGQQPPISEKVLDKDKVVTQQQNSAVQQKSLAHEEKNTDLKNSAQQLCFKTYTANDNDTLWKIAERVYGSGKWYPAILFHNPDLSIYQISHANQIRYLCDRSIVTTLYKQQIFRRKKGALKGLFWRYTVRQGDTFMNLQNRYCPRNTQGAIQTECCMDIDGKTGLTLLPEPGTKILIRLE